MTAVCLALLHHSSRERGYRDIWHSPVPVGLLGTFLLALSIPLSTSRSCTVLVLLLLAGAALHLALALRRTRSGRVMIPVFAASALVALVVGFSVAQPIILQRLEKTSEQFEELRARGDFGSRQQLYRDTWHMAQAHLVFGWGLDSYPLIFFYRYNTQDSPRDRLPVFYNDAHSDWLQALAEVGIVGTTLLGLHGLVPLLALRRRGPIGLLPGFLFAGCALILLYAWVEFPFGNPAVVITWWLCFFAAVQHVRIDHRLRPASSA
jgi:O-antigen ligase